MISEQRDRPERDRLVELDRHAWNLPSPSLAPAGPAREVWPVRPSPTVVDEPRQEDPAAA